MYHMPPRSRASVLFLMGLSCHALGQTPGLEATSVLHLDGTHQPSPSAGFDDFPITLTDAELGLSWRTPERLAVHGLLVHAEGNVEIQEAFCAWTPGNSTFQFGRYTLPHGVYADRLIHDPLLQQDVESILPGAGIQQEFGPFRTALHLSSRRTLRETPSLEEGVPATSVEHHQAVVTPMLEVGFLDEGLVRLSSQWSRHLQGLDFAATVPVGPTLLDGEILVADGAEAPADLAFLAGLSWACSHTATISSRMDGRLADDRWQKAVAAGGSWSFVPGAALGLE